MHFQLPEELQKKRLELREFLTAEIRPIADVRDHQGPLTKPELKDLIKKLEPIGYVQSPIPRELGGEDRSYLERVVYSEELSRVWTSLAATLDTHSGCVEFIAKDGQDWMKEKFVPGGLSGDLIFCGMMSEPEAGSDTRNLKTTAIPNEDGWLVNGVKMWPTNGPWADVGILTALSAPEAFRKNPRTGVINLVVEKKVSPWSARDLPFIGLRAGTTGYIEFKDCQVPKENLLHGATQGYNQNLVGRGWARVNIAAIGLGLMQAAFEDAVQFSMERMTFGKPIAGHQLIQQMIADMAIDLDAGRLLVYRAAEMMDQGIRCDIEQNMTKAFVGEASKRVADNAIQIHGARGLTTHEGFRTERYYRDARTGSIAEGTTQILKLVIARRILGIAAY